MLAKDFYNDIYWPRCQEILREVTQVSYEGCWKKHIEPAIGDMDLNEITPRYLDQWLKEKNITAGTWRVTKAFIRTAYKYEEIDRDPCDRCLNAPPRKRPNPPTLSYDEMQELMDGLKGTYIYTTICCSCYCGLRREEACGLMWEDFEWGVEIGELSYVTIQRGAQYLNGKEIFVEPKTLLSKRRLPLAHDLVKRIYPYRKSSGRLLGNHHVHQAADYYREITKLRNLPYVPMSNLRTSWATYMINNGVPVSLISRYMGHADVETTVRWYTKPNEKELDVLTDAWPPKSNNTSDYTQIDIFTQHPEKVVNNTQPNLFQQEIKEPSHNEVSISDETIQQKLDQQPELTNILKSVLEVIMKN